MKRISPTTYCNLRSCKLKGILSENHYPPLLPISPVAYLGSIIHRLFELASKGKISNTDELNKTWTNLIEQTEEKISKNPLEAHLVPLESNTRNFEVKRIMAYNAVQKIISNKKTDAKTTEYISEKWLKTEDGRVVGMADIIYQNKKYVEIIDLKTGIITEEINNNTTVKQDYQIQLKMYAALYFLSNGFWPNKLIIEGLNKQKYEIAFEPKECLDIINNAKKEFYEINIGIENGNTPKDFANPTKDSCKYCIYRPSCKEYWSKRENIDSWPIDIRGVYKDKTRLGNGYYKIDITDKDRKISIRNLSERHSFLESNFHKLIFCDLGHDTTIDHYIETPFTTGYVLD